MGVPLVTLAGKIAVHRSGVSILTNVGLPEFIAESPEEYERNARNLANDQPRLLKLRETLRPQMMQSPLMDASAFTRGVEDAFRKIWREWCST
jgi:predicted O-linked N-acetylglucosamine transferase (SPINDLY family)